MTSPTVALSYLSQTYALAGSQALLDDPFVGPTTNPIASIISPDGNTLYYLDSFLDLNIVDITDPANPSDEGTATDIDGLCTNAAIVGLAFDATGRYLYVPDGTTSLYTLDLVDPLVPVLDHTLTIPTAANTSRHVIVLGYSAGSTQDRLYIMCDNTGGTSTYQAVDISTPDVPTLGSSVSGVDLGDGVARGYLAGDNATILFPELPGASPEGKIYPFSALDALLGALVAIDLPDFGSDTITVSGALNFDASIDASKCWCIGTFTASGAKSYFWMVLDKWGADWSGIHVSVAADTVTGSVPALGGGGDLTPSHYVANEPYDAFAMGIADSEIVVEISAPDITATARLQFWALDANETFPILVIKEGGHRSEELAGFRTFYTLAIQSGLMAGIGAKFTVDANDDIWISGAAFVYVPASVAVTSLGAQDITADVRTDEGIRVSYGITDNGVLDRVAQTGSMVFRLNNYATPGLYSPGHAAQKAGFVVGAPITLSLDGYTKFVGRIESITPDVSIEPGSSTVVTCVDAMDVMSRARAKGIPVRTNITASRIVEIALAEATGLPIMSGVANAIDSTDAEYPFAFDSLQDKEGELIREVQDATVSERGFFYPAYQHADVGSLGGLRFESGDVRFNSPVFAAPVIGDGTIRSIRPEHSSSTVYNRVRGRVFPRELDSAATTILFTLRDTPKIKKGESLTFTAPYTDPSERASGASGIEMRPPTANTDYKFTAKETGGGTNLTSSLSVNVEFGASSAEVTLTNLGRTGWVFLFQLKGRGLYSYEPLTVTKRDVTSIVKYGLSDITLDLPHEGDLTVASGVVDNVLTAYAEPRTFIRSASFVASKNATTLTAFLECDIGKKYLVDVDGVGISMGTTSPFILETSVLDGTDELADEAGVYVVHSIAFSVGGAGIVESTWGLFPANVRL